MKNLKFNYLTKNTGSININHHACADSLIEEWYDTNVLQVLDNSTVVLVTEMQLLRVRIGVQEGQIAPFLLHIDDSIMARCDRKGDLDTWPESVCVLDKYMSRKLGW